MKTGRKYKNNINGKSVVRSFLRKRHSLSRAEHISFIILTQFLFLFLLGDIRNRYEAILIGDARCIQLSPNFLIIFQFQPYFIKVIISFIS